MRFYSRAFRALLRRNFIYRKRTPTASLLEILLPVAFVCILVAIKIPLENTDGFKPETVEATFPEDKDAFIPFGIIDYVTAIQAERICFYSQTKQDFEISGLPYEGWSWQVPFVKCDSRACTSDGEDAKYKYCEYAVLAVAPADGDDLAKERADEFENYVYAKYPQLQQELPGGHLFVKEFPSESAIEDYVKADNYGDSGVPKIGVAVILYGATGDGKKKKNFGYKIRVNSTNFNSPDLENGPGMQTTPPTDTKFKRYEKSDGNSCPLEDAPDLGPFQTSCTRQYNYNGALTIQRLVDDWIIETSGAQKKGYFVAENGVRFVPFPTREYVENGFYEAISEFAPLLVTLGLLYPISTMIRSITLEKESRQKELMKIMSVNESDIGWAWFTSYFVYHLITVIGLTWATSALYSNSSVALLFYFWFLTIISAAIVFSMFISSFMSKSTRATLIGLLLFFVGFFLTLTTDFETGSSGIIGGVSFHPVAAFSFGLQEIGRLEDLGVGVTSDNYDSTDTPSGFTFQKSLRALIVDAVLWGLLGWYFNRALPSKFGQPLPWYFPLKLSYWCPNRAKAPLGGGTAFEAGSGDVNIPIEPVSEALKEQEREGRSIEIRGLTKKYGEKLVLDSLNLSMYSGHVTALLGHNGAGKTTTIGMLTGMIGSSGGHAVVAGKDIRTQMPQIRQEMGICFQHDCLFPLLTVKEHIQFFSRIKGLYANKQEDEAEASIMSSLEDVALLEKSGSLSCNLSGGMKRKLSVAIAFCGDSKIVLLDEPTSGMDPFSRRFTWNVIRQYRQDRCILLTTHFMDEADILGDRIAILGEGQLRCMGSSLFLKKSYGVGYQLTIEKKTSKAVNSEEALGVPLPYVAANPTDAEDAEDTLEKADTDITTTQEGSSIDEVLNRIVTGTVNGAQVLSNVGTEMSFQLPLGSSSQFREMFDELDNEVDKGNIVTYGVGITTLDEVFLMVARGETGEGRTFADSIKKESIRRESLRLSAPEDYLSPRINLEDEGLFLRHVGALFRKRAMNFKRDKRAWIFSTILPALFVMAGFIVFKVMPKQDLDALTLTLTDYNPDVFLTPRNPILFNDGSYNCQPGICSYISETIYSEWGNYSFCGHSASVDPFGANDTTRKQCTLSHTASIANRINKTQEEAGAGAVSHDASTTVESSRGLDDTSHRFAATQYGALFFTHDSSSTFDSDGGLNNYSNEAVSACVDKASTDDYINVSQCEYYRGLGYLVSYNYTAVHVSLLYQAIADEAIMAEALQDDDVSISVTIHPLPKTKVEEGWQEAFDSYLAWVLIVLSFPFIAGTFGTFVVTEKASKARHLQTVAGVQPSAYWLSTYLWDIMNYQIPLWITVILMFSFDVDTFTTRESKVLGGILVLLILFGPASAGFTYCQSFLFKSPSTCNLFVIVFNFLIGMAGPLVLVNLRWIGKNPANPIDTLVLISDIIMWFLRPIPSFCLANGLINTIFIEAWREWDDESVTAWSKNVLLWDVVCLLLECFVYILLAIQIDVWSTNPRAVALWKDFYTCRWLGRKRVIDEGITAAQEDDEDVVREAERVETGEADGEQIVVQQMTKQYPNGKLAVNNVSFAVPGGECFGLLGINGAGKTTLMAMLTAEFPPTDGDATLVGYSVTKQPELTRRCIGYCPQFDAHFQNMTGREHVELYASIKGMPRSLVKEAAKAQLKEVGLSDEDSDRLSIGYSGGMKRKLSVACAMIGRPRILFLDEPTTGMDPVARRDVWKVISDMVIDACSEDDDKTSIILTTHSMEEAEAVCPRIGIMANGKLRCLGSAQHLKTRFGQGYQVEIKLRDVEDEDEDFRSFVAQLLTPGIFESGELHEGARPRSTSLFRRSLEGTESPLDGGQRRSSLRPEGDVEIGELNAKEVFLDVDQAVHALNVFSGDEYLSSMLNASDPTGYSIWRSASSDIGVSVDSLAEFCAAELRMRNLKVFFEREYPNSILRERQEAKARFEVVSEGIRISVLFSNIEENKDELMVADYGISQTSLEQVFNMHAAEAEKLKQGTHDN